MKIIDISWPITETITAYKDRRTVVFEQTKQFDADNVRESKITLGSHTGTHVDAPAHFMRDGSTIETSPLNQLVGKCVVLDLTHVQERITREDLATQTIPERTRVLLKTSNSALSPDAPFYPEFVYLEKSGAEYLASLHVATVGIDYLGVERAQPDHETHTTLMQANIPIIEGLRLAHVEPGEYRLVCLPLAVQGLEAAPARAVLLPS